MRIFDSVKIFAVLLSMLGLISCSPEKTDTSVGKTIPDNFKADPVIQKEDDGEIIQIRDPRAGVLDHPMSVLDRVYFPTLANLDFKRDPIRIEVFTSCSNSNGKFEATSTFHDRSEIELINLLPTAVLFQPDPKTQSAFCLITFEVFNKNQSKYTVRIPGFELTAAQANLNLTLAQDHVPFASENPYSLLLATNAARISYIEFSRSAAQISLYCEGFWSSIALKEGEPFDLLRLISSAPQSYSGHPLIDRNSKPRQICRVTRDLIDSDGNNRVVSSTSYFEMQFGITPLEIQAEWMMNMYENPFAEIPVFRVQINNPYDTDVPLALPIDTNGALKLIVKPSIRSTSEVDSQLAPLKYTIQGSSVVEKDGLVIFTVNRHSKVEIRATTIPPMECRPITFPGRDIDVIKPNQFIDGFYYAFSPELVPLLQTSDNIYDPASAFNGTHKHVLFANLEVNNTQPLPGWAPWDYIGNYDTKDQVPPQLRKATVMPNIAKRRTVGCLNRGSIPMRWAEFLRNGPR